MPRSPLLGRRIHIAGCVSRDPAIATETNVAATRHLIERLTKSLCKLGANFVVPVDKEVVRDADGLPICFDWLVWKTMSKAISTRPTNTPGPLAVAVQHHKTEDQIPEEYENVWETLRNSDLVTIDSAAQWDMNSKRMEIAAKHGDILIAIGGGEGVRYLANLYHDAGKPVVPLNLPIVPAGAGSRELHAFGMSSAHSAKLFEIAGDACSHHWMNKINFASRHTNEQRVANLVDLLENLERPSCFAVRLLDPAHEEFQAVQDFFDGIVQPFVEDTLGYRFRVIDGLQKHDKARIDEEIFAKLHKSALVVADLTGARPNCFLELGYALGRSIPTLVTARSGFEAPFDLTTLAAHHWVTNGTAKQRQRALEDHWKAVRTRPPLVQSQGLLP